jgi:hypothetical protein
VWVLPIAGSTDTSELHCSTTVVALVSITARREGHGQGKIETDIGLIVEIGPLALRQWQELTVTTPRKQGDHQT